MKNFRKYGVAPYNVVVVHGGPGAAGSMAPVAKELSGISGILEPLLASKSVDGQLQELEVIIREQSDLPVILSGHSWGAWLVYIFAAHYPEMVKKLILISSGPFEEKYASEINEIRLKRLIEEEKTELYSIQDALNDPGTENKDAIFKRLGELISMTDSFNPLPRTNEEIVISYDIFQSVWDEAHDMRKRRRLLAFGKQIHCPVLAIHGDYDPHPYKGVERPLSHIIKDFRFVLLSKCGHEPWLEKLARERFFEVLRMELV
ncbi:MAG: alpha/beta hydrolase [Bacteroidales bacterium]|nr:MAG: alpha/beta hydrolase [Bacteroidales bacterium]